MTTVRLTTDRLDFAVSNQKKLGMKEAEMKIVDSLLNFNFFLSGEVQENLSLFVPLMQRTSPGDSKPAPPDTTWIRHTSDQNGTWRKKHVEGTEGGRAFYPFRNLFECAIPGIFQVCFSLKLLDFCLSFDASHGGTMRIIDSRRTYLCLLAVLFFTAIAIPCVGWAQGSGTAQYHLVKKVVLGGEGGWDYFTADPATHKVFIARGSYVMVVDPEGKVTDQLDVGRGNEAHAVAFAPDLHRAFTSNGGGSSVTIFDPERLKVISQVKIQGRDTDDIMYEPATKRVFTFDGGKGHDSTAIDAVKGILV